LHIIVSLFLNLAGYCAGVLFITFQATVILEIGEEQFVNSRTLGGWITFVS